MPALVSVTGGGILELGKGITSVEHLATACANLSIGLVRAGIEGVTLQLLIGSVDVVEVEVLNNIFS
jgi:hypothetical protein